MMSILNYWDPGTDVNSIDKAQVLQFVEWAHDELGLAPSTIGRTIRVLRAALNFGAIDVSWMCKARGLCLTDKGIADRLNVPEIVNPIYDPSDDEIVAFCEEAKRSPSLWRWTLIMLATGCRPQAAIEVGPKSVNFDTREINLNPPGRRQIEKKYRPTVLIPNFLWVRLETWAPIGRGKWGSQYCGYTSYHGLRSTFRRVAKDAGVPELTTYSFRHKIATVMRNARVPFNVAEYQLGHLRPGGTINSRYGSFELSYLDPAKTAIEEWWKSLRIDLEPEAFLARDSHGEDSELSKNGRKTGAGDEIRTHDPNLGKVVLYP